MSGLKEAIRNMYLEFVKTATDVELTATQRASRPT
jgi:hypothetical protein